MVQLGLYFTIATNLLQKSSTTVCIFGVFPTPPKMPNYKNTAQLMHAKVELQKKKETH